jgi:hypothetical protein
VTQSAMDGQYRVSLGVMGQAWTHLEHLLVLFGVGMLHLLSGRDVVLEVATCVLPCLQALVEKLGDLAGVLIRDGIVVGHVCSRSGGQAAFCVGHVCGSVCAMGRAVVLCDRRKSAKGHKRGAMRTTQKGWPTLDVGTRGK